MLLIDALFLNSPGGITLLKYLSENLELRGLDSFYLLDQRTKGNFSFISNSKRTFLESTLKNRKQFYLDNNSDFSRVLCFSNIPPPIPLSVPAYTFLQNVLLLQDCPYVPIKSRILNYLKRKLIFYHRKNTSTWIVQSGFMKQLLISKYSIPSKQVQILPFFYLSKKREATLSCKKPNSFIYPSTGLGHKNHLILLKAWELIHLEGHNFELHLTIPETDIKLIKLISVLKTSGLNILNHGIIAQGELITLYQSCEYLVYPSLNESFGLPLIEAIQYHCKVIAADLPYSKETVIPSAIFNPYDPYSLKNAILEATSHKDNEKKSEIITENKIDELIELLNTSINT